MPDDQTPSPLANWTPERIREVMRTEHNINWAPPPIKDTWKEEAVESDVEVTMPESMRESAAEMLADPAAHVSPDTVEGIARAGGVTQEQLDQWRQRSAQGNDSLAGTPRDQLDAVMREHGMPAETRAQARWAARMNPQQSQARLMAQITGHPSARPAIRPVVS